LAVEHVHRVVQDGIEQRLFTLQVHKMVPGPQQGHQLIPRPGHVVAIKKRLAGGRVRRVHGQFRGHYELVRRRAFDC
jgi:hypothetical protein